MKILTSIALSKPNIGDINISDNFAPTAPLPFTISSPINSALGSRCEIIPKPNISIRII